MGHFLFAAKLSKLKLKSEETNLLVVGAGNTIIPGWLHSDVVGRAEIHLDFTKPWNIEDKLDAIYGDMILGGIDREEMLTFFKYTFTALKPGGILRLCTLDFIELSRAYLNISNKLEAELVNMRNRAKGYLGEFPIDILFHATCGHYGYNKKFPLGSYLHDTEVIFKYLQEAGFIKITNHNVGDSKNRLLQNLESRSQGVEKYMQTCIEAVKPE